MRLYQNKENNKLLIAFQWDGTQASFNRNLFGNDKNAFNLHEYDFNCHYNSNQSSDSVDFYRGDGFDSEILSVAHKDDYIYRVNSTTNDFDDDEPLLNSMPEDEFQAKYNLYQIVQPNVNHLYVIQRATGEYSDVNVSLVMATGNKKQAQKISHFLNKIACSEDDGYFVDDVSLDGHLNFLTSNYVPWERFN